MRSRILLLTVILFNLIALNKVYAQGNSNNVFISASSSINPGSINTCQGVDTFRFKMLNINAFTLTGVQMTYTLPAGVSYVSSFTSSPGTLTEIDVTDPQQPILGFSDLASGDNPTIEIVVSSDCGVVGQTTLNNYIRIDVSNNATYDELQPTGYIPNNPSLVTTADVSVINAQYGASYSRMYNIRESGNGFLTEVYFERTFGDAYTVDSLLLQTNSGEVNIPFTIISGGTIDTIRVLIDNAALISAGITDGTFDKNDEIEIREVISIVDCSGNNAGQAVAYWECGGIVCEKVNPYSVGILFGAYTPDLAITYSVESQLGILPAGKQYPLAFNCGSSYEKAILVRNVGNETAVNMRFDIYQIDPQSTVLDTAAGFFYQMGVSGPRIPVDSFFLVEAWNASYELSNIAYGGPVPRRVYLYINNQELPVGDSLYLVFSEISYPNDFDLYPTMGCSAGSQGYVRDRVRMQSMLYMDPCLINTYSEGSQGDEAYLYNRLVVGQGSSSTIVFDGGAPGATDFVSNSAILQGFNSIPASYGAIDSSAYMDIKFTLPAGLDYAGDVLDPLDPSFQLISSDGTINWVPDTIIGGDSVFIARYYIATNPKPATFSWTTNTAVHFEYVADCSELVQPACPAQQNNPNVTIKKEFYVVPSTTCNAKFYLDCIQNTDPVQVYCSACPCPLGVQYVGANVERISLGVPDNDRNGIADTMPDGSFQPIDSLNYAEIKTLNFIEGDTLSAYYQGIVHTTAGQPSPGDSVNVFPYMYGSVRVPSTSTFIGLVGSAIVYDSNTGITHVSTIPLPTFSSGTEILVDLSAATLIASGGMSPALPIGFVYEEGDSVRFDMDVRVTRNIGNTELSTDFTLEIFGSDIPFPSTNRRFACIPPGVNKRRLKQFGWREDKSGEATANLNGCKPTILFNMAHNNLWSTGWSDPFPYEHRRLFELPELRFSLPNGFTIVGDSVEIYYYRNNPIGSNINTILKVPFEMIGTDSIRVYDIEKVAQNSPYGDIRSSGSVQVNVRPTFQASCQVPDASLVTIRTRQYVGYNVGHFEELRDSFALSTIDLNSQYNISYSAPQINSIAASPTVSASQQTAMWTVNFQNLALSGVDAYNTWFYFDNSLSGGQITVDSVVSVSSGTVYTANANGFYELGDLLGTTTKQYEVYASFTNCSISCIEWYSGYNCPGYFSSFTDPILGNAGCKPAPDTLCISPTEANWQSAVLQGLDSADLCTENTLIYEFSNVQAGYSYDTKVRIRVPLNSTIETDSVYLTYPSGGTTYLVPTSAIQFNAPSEFIVSIDDVVPGLSASGLPGALVAGQNDFSIAFNFILECDYVSGSSVKTSVYGKNACGSLTNEAGAPNQNVFVYGVPEPYFINPRVSSNDTVSVCNSDITVRINMLKLGSNPIGANDSMRLTLPLGVSYVPFSMVSLNNPLANTEPVVDTIGNIVTNTWLIPTGVAELDSIDFTIDLAVDHTIDCGTPGITVQSFVDNTAYCASLNANCGVKAQTGVRDYNINITRPSLSINDGQTYVFMAPNNVYQIQGEFTNTDTYNDMPAGLTYNLYCADNAGLPYGPLLFTGTLPALSVGDTVAIDETFSSMELCSVSNGVSVQFEKSASNCLCDAGFLVPLKLIPPIVAVNDTDVTDPATLITVVVLENDSSKTATFDTTTVAVLNPATNGTTTVNTDGSINYTPELTFSGTDSFTYMICSQEISVNCDTATVYITVPNTTTAIDDINNTAINTPVSGNVLTNDSDLQGDDVLVNPTPVSGPSNGTLVLNPNGNYTYTPAPGFTGTDVFQYQVCDNGTPQACDTATVYINVIPEPTVGNDPPIATQDVASTEEDTPVDLNLLSNDADPDGDSLTINTTPVSNPSNGSVVINLDGTAVYTPDSGFIGIDTFEYAICDPYGLCDTTQVIINVEPDLQNVVYANDDAGTGLQDNPISGSLTANDFDPEGDTYFINSLTPVTPPTNGSVVLNNDGTYTYTPAPGFVGNDAFTYQLCDNGTPQACDIATVYLTVLPEPNTTTASNDINSTPQDIAVNGNVLTNDVDAQGDVQLVNPTPLVDPTNGTVSLYPNGNYIYTPAPGFSGDDQFTYVVCDNGSPVACDTAVVYITVVANPVAGNNPPVANEDEGTTEVDTPVDGDLLSNDSDPDGDALTVNTTPVTDPVNGSVVINPDGTYTYTPNAGYTGTDSFVYSICDPYGLCDTAVAIITIIEDNGNSTFAQDDAGTGIQDNPITGNVNSNDSDPEGDIQSVNTTPISGTMNGSVVINPDGSYTYTPNPGFVGNDQFVYSTCDNGMPVVCDTATVYLTVLPEYIAPIIAVNDSSTTMVDVPVNINVIANDTADGGFDNTSLAEVTAPANGSISVNTDGTIDYTPNAGYTGIDSFTYVICDNQPTCDTATVYVTITPGPNTPPNAVNDDTTTLEDTPVTINPLTNDTDLEGPLDSTSVTVVTPPNNATASVDPVTGEITITPDPNFVGTIELQYSVCDTGMPVYCDIATITVTITAVPDTLPVTVPEDSTIRVCTNSTVNFEDPISGISICGEPENGSIVPSFIPCLDYTPDPDYVGPDTICVVTCAGAVCDTTIIVIDVTPVNDPPVAVDDTDATEEDTPVTTNVLTNDTDLEGPLDTASVAIVSNPTHGTTTVNPDGTITYTPNPDYVGTDQYTYAVCDTGMPVLCDTAVVTITITPTPDTIYTSTPQDTVLTVCTNTSVNFAGPITSVSMCDLPDNGTTAPNVLPCIDYTPDAGYTGPDTMCIITCSGSICDTTIVIIDVTPVNQPPVANTDRDVTEEDTPVTTNVLANDTDLEGPLDTASVAIVSNPTHGTVVVNPDGTIEYTPNPDYVGTDQYTYAVCDTGMPVLCDTAVVIITINPVADTVYVSVPEDSSTLVCMDTTVNLGGPITSVSMCDFPDNGSVTPSILPCLEYTPDANYVGPDTMCVISCSGSVCDTTIVVIDVTPVNDPPVAVDDAVITSQDSAKLIDIVRNDYDLDGPIDSASIAIVTPPTHGTITAINPDGTVEYTPNPGYTGNDQFTYAVCDTGMPILCDTAVVSIFIGASPDTSYITVPEDSSVVVCLDSLVGMSGLIDNMLSCGGPENGSVDMGLQPCIEYTPNPDYVGPDTLCVISCSNNICDTTIIIIDVTPVNDPPVAVDDSETTEEDTPVSINVVNNDYDTDGVIDSASVSIVTLPTHGSITAINPDGTVEYTPNPGYVGMDQFTYAVCDTGMPVLCDTAVVTITITPAPDTIYTSVPEDSSILVCTSSSVNFAGPITSVSMCDLPNNGSVTPSVLPCVEYAPYPAYIGPDTMCIITCSGSICDTTIVIIDVTPVNQPPVATDDTDVTDEDTPVTTNVLANDADLEGPLDTASVAVVSNPTHGTTTVNPDGTITYTPNPNYVGTDQYTYAVCDTGMPVLCDTAVVTITINPVADTIYVSVPEDSSTLVCMDTTVSLGGPISTISMCDFPDNGSVTPSILPCLEYAPNTNYVGPDTMCVVVCSGSICDTTIVVIDVTPTNDPPVAVDDAVTTPQDSSKVINVVQNDYDTDGVIDSASVAIVTQPTHGTITAINPDGTVEYTPNPGYTGVDQFTYAVCDTGMPVLCDTAVVSILIGATTDTTYITVPEDSSVVVCIDSLVNLGGVLDNLVSCGGPENGSVDMGLLPCIEYTPNPDYVGPDTLCVISCSNGVCDTTIIVIDVTPVNDPPVAVDDTDVTNEDTPVTTNVLVNDSDLEGPLDTASVAVVSNPAHGTVTVNPDGTITYTPETDFVGTDQYTYAVCDTGMPVLCDTAVVTITINPQADTVYTSLPEDSMINLCTTSSTNFENPITSISLCGGPENGTATPSFLPCLTYTPATDYVGMDTVCVISCSGNICDTTIFIIEVTPVNDPPVAVDDTDVTTEDTPVTTNVLVNDSDLDGPLDTTSVAVVTNPAHGTVTVNTDGTITYTPESGYVGTDQYTYAVCDTGMPVLCDTAVVTITITPAPDTTYVTTNEEEPVTVCTDSLTNFQNPITSVSICGYPANGALSTEFTPCITYTPETDFYGMDTFCIITCSGNVCDTTYTIVTVLPIIDNPVVNPIEDICESEPTPALTGTSEPGSVINWYDAMNTLVGTGTAVVPPVTSGVNCFYAVAENTTFGLYSDTVEVCFNVDSLPVNVYAGPDDTLCGYHDYELQATGNGLQTFWTQIAGNSVGIASSNPNAIVALEPLNSPGTSNLYTFVWTNTNGLCVVRDTVNIVITNPHLTFAGNDTSVCIPEAGGSVTLNATLTPSATGYWEYNGNGNIAFADSTDPHTEVSGLIPYVNPSSTYRFYWYEVIGDCIARDEVVITVNEAPGLEVADSAIACLGSDFLLDANVSGISQASYSWRLNSPSGTILAWDEDVIVNPTQNTTYYVVASVGFGQNFCRTIDSIEVVVDGAPIAFNDGCYDVMEDDTLTGSTADWGANDDYSAVFGTVGYEVITASSLSPASSLEIDNTTGTYTFTPFTDMSGSDTAMIAVYNANCPDLRDTFYVCFNVIPVVDSPIVAANDTDHVVAYGSVDIFILDNDTLNDNAFETIITLLTEPNNGTVENNGDYVTYTSTTGTANVDSFMYSVCNVLADGETLCDTAWVYVITDGDLYIPEGFTPNGDGVNDYFVIPDLTLLYPNATFKVFNRWGDEVWNSGGVYQNDFSGHNFSGTQLPDGTYFYIIELNDGSGRSKASYLVIYR